MEALTAASAAALTIYDMCKAAGKEMIIGPTMLFRKTGGKNGDFRTLNLTKGRRHYFIPPNASSVHERYDGFLENQVCPSPVQLPLQIQEVQKHFFLY